MSLNLNENLQKSAELYPENIAFNYLGQTATYAQLDQMASRFASALRARGVGKGDTVGVLMGNTPEFIIAYYGILRTGAAVVPINPIYTSAEISYILSNSRAKAVVAIASLEPVVNKLKEQLENLAFTVYTEPVGSELTVEALLQENDNLMETVHIDEEDLAVVLYTSGTTGHPKGAMLTHRNLASNAEATAILFELDKTDRMVAVLPLFHVFCMTVCMNAPISTGATILLVPKFSPVEVVRTIRAEAATMFAGVPTMYNFMLQLPDATADDFASLRFCVSGGAAIPVELLHRFEEKYGTNILEGYGLTESSPVASFNPVRGTRKPGSIGKQIPGVQCRVVDAEGNEVPRGNVGELIIQGANVMKGYLGMPEETTSALREGWLYTGDLARMDEEDYIYIVDRKKDMIIVGGYNVYPREVEEVLYLHPHVLEAAVIGVPDEEYGEIVQAYVVKKQESVTHDDLWQFCKEKLAKYKIPKQIEFLDELPKNSTGKILRRALRRL
ncbi:MAG: long-chain-fatty-acid--CoA ligase [Clostridia bacterium]